MRFVTSVYGKKYGGMLLSLLYSVRQSNPNARMTIYWQDVASETLLLKKVFSEFDFVDTTHDVSYDLVNRIAHKTLLWADAAARHKHERIVFVDVDMLILKDLSGFFDDSFDIAFTYKDEQYPVNTGTFLACGSTATEEFFKKWHSETKKILSDPLLRARATSSSYPYGAPDQMAFYTLIEFKRGSTEYAVTVGGKRLRCKGLPCELLNETNSRPLNDRMHIIHYKGGWHSILIDGTDFTPRRPKEDSWEMYLLYLKTYREALAYAAQRLGNRMPRKGFGITRPLYLNESLDVSPLLYTVFSFKEKALGPIRRLTMRMRRKINA